MEALAKLLVLIGIGLLVVGGLVYLAGRAGLVFGRLPGDIRIGGGNMTCVVALGTSLLLSVVLTILLNVIVRFLNK